MIKMNHYWAKVLKFYLILKKKKKKRKKKGVDFVVEYFVGRLGKFHTPTPSF